MKLQDAVAYWLDLLQRSKTSLAKLIGEQAEFKRQIDYHLARGDQDNANNVEPSFITWGGYIETEKINVARYQKEYDDAAKVLNDALRNLTPTQQQEIKTQQEIAVSQNKAAQAKQETQLAAQSTTKYLIIGGVVLVAVLILGLFWWKRGA